ncbi:MAG: ribonuclease domain-containing protein [Accumulibacter sp.]|uniref:ribonuclease domain-containing protein n=1 Tax=Accumulibacter sp. TaxID=2053492 RepID=UPI00331565A1
MKPWLRFLIVAWLAIGGALGLARDNVVPQEDFLRGVVDWIPLADLPREARQTLALIKAGGPFPYARDGVVFGNYERRLPTRPRGYYHEYTVKTPGRHDRGARRIIAGGEQTYFYTDDHYRSFRRIRE